jgi:hypothetical protein
VSVRPCILLCCHHRLVVSSIAISHNNQDQNQKCTHIVRTHVHYYHIIHALELQGGMITCNALIVIHCISTNHYRHIISPETTNYIQ